MKKIILKLCLLVSVILPVSVQAGPVISGGGLGDMAEYIKCGSNRKSFVIRSTAAPDFKQGLLKLGKNNYITLKCDELNIPLFEAQPSAGSLLWSCREYPNHDGNVLVRIEQSGATGLKSAYISRMQMFPLEPKAIATLNCK